MIERISQNEIIENVKMLKDNTKMFKQIVEEMSTEEDKQSEEYKALVEESDTLEEGIEKVFSEEEREEIKKLSEIQTYIEKIGEILNDGDADPELKKRAEKQIRMIRSSYTLECLNDPNVRPTMKSKRLKENFINLRKSAEQKMEKNQSFRFYSAYSIESKIKTILPEELKGKARLTASFIYAVINTVSLKPDGYAMFVFFLIKNINNIERDFTEKEELISNLTKLAESL
jgi:hypothetical protein